MTIIENNLLVSGADWIRLPESVSQISARMVSAVGQDRFCGPATRMQGRR